MIWIDIQMPKCCDECFALDDHGDYPFCLISQDQRGYTFNVREKRMPTCPLKAQEPRVMTLDEIKALPDYVFLEDRDISHAFSIITISRPALPQLVFVNTSGEECVEFRGPDGDTSLVSSRYGAEWRCWTSRPDQATREAVKWDG